MDKPKTRMVFHKAIPKSLGRFEPRVEVYDTHADYLLDLLFQLSCIPPEDLEECSEPMNLNPVEYLKAIRSCLFGTTRKDLETQDFIWGETDYEELIEALKFFKENGYQSNFKGKPAYVSFVQSGWIFMVGSYIKEKEKWDFSKAKARTHNIRAIHTELSTFLRPDCSKYQAYIMTGKICEIVGIIQPLEGQEKYSDVKDYYRQTVRNAVEGATS